MLHGRAGRRFAGIVLIGVLIGAFGLARVAGAQTTGDQSSTTTSSQSTSPAGGRRPSGTAGHKHRPASDTTGGGANASVVGGVPVSTASFPWMAALLDASTSDPFDAQFCGGTLIDPEYVLTSADCVDGAAASDIEVALGHDDLNTIQPADRRTLAQIVEDPAFNSMTGEHNTALLKLTAPALGIPTAAYAIDATNEAIGTQGGFMGWGDTGFGDTTLHGGATYVQTTPSTLTCGAWGGTPAYFNTSMMCIGQSLTGGSPATCNYDEGDPFVVGSPGGYRVVGINLGGPPSCGQDLPDIYARVSASASFITTTLNAPSGAGTYHPVAPVRVLDTRGTTGGLASGALGPSAVINAQLTGMGTGGVPVDQGADAVVLNLVSVGPTSSGWLTAFPTGGAPPLAANLNFDPGSNVSNLVTVQLGQGGKVSIANSTGSPSAGYVHVVADLVGWYSDDATGELFDAASPPARMLDTRNHSGFANAFGTQNGLGAGAPTTTVDFCQPMFAGPIPSGVTALAINATVVPVPRYNTIPPVPLSGYGGWLTMWPSGPAPVAANVTHDGIHTAGSLSIVTTNGCNFLMANSPGDPAGSNNHTGMHVILDVVGWYGAGGFEFHPMPPNRVLDTRTGTTDNPGIGAIGGGATIDVAARAGSTGVPVTASAVIANTTAIGPAASGWLTLYPQDPVPAVSSLNFAAGAVVANLVGVGFAGPGNTIRLGNTTFPSAVTIPQGPVNVVMDVSGWFE